MFPNALIRRAMAKRVHSDTEENYDRDYVTNEHESALGSGITPSNSNVVPSLLRMVITRQARNQKIRREHFTLILHSHNLKGNTKPWITTVNSELKALFGLELIPSGGSDLSVVSCLQSESKRAFGKLIRMEQNLEESGRSLQDPLFYLPRQKRSQLIVNTTELLQGGIAMLIICIIVVNGNRVREADLIETLTEFGFSENLNIQVANLNKSSQDVLQELTKREYLHKSVSNSSDRSNLQIVDYSLGKRSIREFAPQDMLAVIEEIMGFDNERNQKCVKTVQLCFPNTWKPTQNIASPEGQINFPETS